MGGREREEIRDVHLEERRQRRHHLQARGVVAALDGVHVAELQADALGDLGDRERLFLSELPDPSAKELLERAHEGEKP
jgi:hypothetical protein